MKKNIAGGSIINTASIAGMGGGSGPLAYSAAKAGVINFCKNAAIELGPDKIRVNAISPGAINTPLLATAIEDSKLIQPIEDFGMPNAGCTEIHYLEKTNSKDHEDNFSIFNRNRFFQCILFKIQ